MKSRSLSIASPGVIDVVEQEVPRLGPDDLLVNVRVGGVCRGDVEAFRGDESVPTPYIGGHESAGTVLEVGSTVTRFRAGDNVALLGDGRFTQYSVANQREAALLPDDISDWRDWVIEPVACAANGVDVAGVSFDDVVGVVGAGYMGQLVIRVLRSTPFRELIAFDVNDAALAAAERSGATRTYRVDQPEEELDRELESVIFRRPMPASYVLPGLENGPFDVVFETSGTAQGLRTASRLVRVGGMLVMFGHQRGLVEINGTQWHLKGIRVVNGAPMSAVDFHDILNRTAAMISAQRIDLRNLVSHSGSLDDGQIVYDASGKPGYVKGSILFDASTSGESA
ncbi:MAG: alcohol dehydrogenase catalytic domain-containing protein [Terrimesophilobacter sp.]